MLYRFDGNQPLVGEETYVSESAVVVGAVTIGNYCYIGHGVILRGDYGRIVIGNGTAVEEGVIVHAPPGESCTIGNRVTIGHGAIIHSKHIDDSAVIGMGAIISIRAEVGRDAIVAEGAVVKKEHKVEAGKVVAGNPARVVRNTSEQDKEYWNWAKDIYIDLAKKYCLLGMERVK
jgi:carbonic anhydrase/acetyltransferase-like protein (isoleucine patch superfamily)